MNQLGTPSSGFLPDHLEAEALVEADVFRPVGLEVADFPTRV